MTEKVYIADTEEQLDRLLEKFLQEGYYERTALFVLPDIPTAFFTNPDTCTVTYDWLTDESILDGLEIVYDGRTYN